jgi:sarcosine oxidase subunit beta
MVGGSAHTVIIGAGVVGASVAYHLAARGVRRIVVVDRHQQPGQGSTGRATGGLRAQHASWVNVRLTLLSREKLLRFREELGVDPGYRPCGYLFIAGNEAELDALREARRVQRLAGLVETQEVGVQDIARLNPALTPEGIAGGTFCPIDGFIRPLEIMRGYMEGAKRLGVEFELGAEFWGFEMEASGRIGAVKTSRGAVAAGCVVNAAGAWAGLVAKHAGVDIPVVPLRRQVASTVPCDLLPEEMPMTVFAGDGFHLRVRDGRVLLLWPTTLPAADPFDTSFDPGWLEGVVSRAHARLPCLQQVAIDQAACWAGLYEMSPDDHAIVGLAPGVENFYLVNGSSGHGVMHSPALGQLVVEQIVEGKARTLDIHALRPSRFSEGQLNPVSNLL